MTVKLDRVPESCQVCGARFTPIDSIYDARTRTGHWAWVCEDCFESFGVGLGTGMGQRYELKNGEWLKVEG